MIRKITCKNCKEEFNIKSNSNSRHQLEDQRGRYFYESCEHCKMEHEYHVNEVKATNRGSNLVIFITLGITLFLIIIKYIFQLGLVGIIALAVPAFVYLRMKQNAEKSVRLFNKGDISRTRPV